MNAVRHVARRLFLVPTMLVLTALFLFFSRS